MSFSLKRAVGITYVKLKISKDNSISFDQTGIVENDEWGYTNVRIRYTDYLWVEAVAIIPTTEYYTTKYSIDQ